MYDRFTDRVRKVIQLANQEAQRYRHEYIGTEHILLGLVAEGSGVAANVLKNLDTDLSKIRREVEKIILPGPGERPTGKLPQTPRMKKVIEYSIDEARKLNHNYIGTEHLLLGLLRDDIGVAVQVLLNLGLNLSNVREEVLRLLGPTIAPANPVVKIKDALAEPIQAVAEIEAEIDQLSREKENAVAEHDFERAADLHNQADKLKKRREVLLRDWLAQHPIDPTWLTWNGGTVLRFARAIDDSRRWTFLPLLGEILSAAGCTNADILDHCRQPGPHGRHCWVTDLLLSQK